MLFISRTLVGLLAVPITILIFLAVASSTLLLIANGLEEATVLIFAACGYLGVIGFDALLRLTYSNNLTHISKRYIVFGLCSGLVSLFLFMYIFSFDATVQIMSILIIMLSFYQVFRWRSSNRIKR